jgi:hypothetical protein
MDTVNVKVLQHTVKLVRSHQENTSWLFGDGVILHFDFAHLSRAQQTWNLLEKVGWEMDHALYSPDLVPSNFHLFPALKKHLSGHCFTRDEDIKCATIMWLACRGHTFYMSWMDKLITCYDRWLSCQGVCVEKQRTSNAFIV